MHLKKILLVLFLPLSLHLFFGCCDCEDSVFFLYTNCDLELAALDNTGLEPVEIIGVAALDRRAFGIRTTIERKENICLHLPASRFISTANATTCDCPPLEIYEPKDTLLTLKIFTINDFDADHLANSDVTDYFRYLRAPNLLPVNDFISQNSLNLNSDSQFILKLDFLLTTPPPNAGVHQFRVEAVLSDGRTLRQTTNEINLE